MSTPYQSTNIGNPDFFPMPQWFTLKSISAPRSSCSTRICSVIPILVARYRKKALRLGHIKLGTSLMRAWLKLYCSLPAHLYLLPLVLRVGATRKRNQLPQAGDQVLEEEHRSFFLLLVV